MRPEPPEAPGKLCDLPHVLFYLFFESLVFVRSFGFFETGFQVAQGGLKLIIVAKGDADLLMPRLVLRNAGTAGADHHTWLDCPYTEERRCRLPFWGQRKLDQAGNGGKRPALGAAASLPPVFGIEETVLWAQLGSQTFPGKCKLCREGRDGF